MFNIIKTTNYNLLKNFLRLYFELTYFIAKI